MTVNDKKNLTKTVGQILGPARKFAEDCMRKFTEQASPAQMLELAKLVKGARAMERKAELAAYSIEANRDLSMRAMGLRERLLDRVIDRMDKNDSWLDGVMEKLMAMEDPKMIAQLAPVIEKLATTDQLSAAGNLMGSINMDSVDCDLEF